MLGVVAMGKDERQGCNASYWEAAKRSQVAIIELLFFCKSTSVILRDALPASQRLCANGPFEDCQVRMFVKQRALPSANVCDAGLIAKYECF